MNMFNRKKRGVIDNFTLIVITVLVSFVILFIFVYNAFASVDTDFDACHLSIQERSTYNLGPFEPAREYVPLNCRTQKLCLQANKREGCETSGIVSTKDNAVKKIEISAKPQKIKGDILSEISDSMYRCHSMMGEGKLNFMPTGNYDNNYCVVCTKFGVDDKLKSEVLAPVITQRDLYNYLAEREDNQDVSYLKRIYGVDSVKDIELYINEAGTKADSSNSFDFKLLDDYTIDLNKGSYSIIVQMQKKGDGWVTAGSFVLGGVVLIAFPYLGIAGITTSALIGSGAGFMSFYYFDNTEEFVYGAPTIVPYDADTLKALKCTDLEGAP